MSVRHDWYQTDQKVVITVLLKNASEKNCKILIESQCVLIEADDNIRLEFKLFQSCNAQESTYRISSVKIEITLIKLIGVRWDQLCIAPKTVAPEPTAVAGIFRKDWDKVTKEIEKDVKSEEVRCAV